MLAYFIAIQTVTALPSYLLEHNLKYPELNLQAFELLLDVSRKKYFVKYNCLPRASTRQLHLIYLRFVK